MNLDTVCRGRNTVVVIQRDTPVITDVQSALDLIATISYKWGCNRVAIHQSAVADDFFQLRTGLAGEVLQKFVTYRTKLAIIGDFSGYESNALRDFIGECNRGNAVFFVPDEATAVERLDE